MPAAPRPAQDRSDATLVGWVLEGDREQYAELVHRYKPIVIARVYLKVKDRDTAECLAQEAFVRAYVRLESLNKPGAFFSWLMNIANNVCIDYLRQASRHLPLESEGAGGTPEQRPLKPLAAQPVIEEITRRELRDQLLAAIDALPADYRLTLTLRFVQGLSCAEIAHELGVSVGTVTSRLSRANRILRKKLEPLIR